MSDQSPTQSPPTAQQSGTDFSGSADAVPSLTPGSAVQAASDGAAGAWLNDKRVTALWGINQNRNSWVHVNGIGWKKLSNSSDSAVVALTLLSSHAKQTQTTYSYREEADGMIHETYVW